MDADTARRCFEPVFTARPSGDGTGLGLAIVYGAVTQADGEISVASARGHGTTFTMRLPRVEEPTVHDVRADGPTGSARVLLVDDDAAVRRFAQRVLAGGGYAVTEAASLQGALAEIARLGPPDLVITDVVMPGGSGLALAEQLVDVAPGTSILLISGYVDDVTHEASAAGGRFPLLRKPFHPAELLRSAEDTLAGRAQTYASKR
jgi:CheY-like chemotaxis protein